MLANKKNKWGFTLIEIVIAMVIIGASVGTLLSVAGAITRATTNPEMVNIASALAEEQIEKTTALRFSEIANVAPTSFGGDFSNYTYQVTVDAVPGTLALDPLMINYKQVAITVSHPQAGSVQLTTIVANKN